MELRVSGKLKTATAKQPSFNGFRIEALFDRKPVLTPSPPPTSGPLTAEVIEIDDVSASHIETGLERAPHGIAPTSSMSNSAESPISFRVSTLSDDAGNFTMVFPNPHGIATETVKLRVSLPAGRLIRDMDVMTSDLGKFITIEVETPDDGSLREAPPKVNTPQSVAVNALFTTDAALRRAITDNLKSLRGESEAVAARVETAWKFRPSRLSAEELARRHYVAPGSDPGAVLETVIMGGVEALRSAKTERALTLRNSAELRKLIKSNREPGDSLQGVVELDQLIEFIQRRGAGPIQGADLTSTPYRAEAEAEAILDAVGNGDRGGDDDLAVHRQALSFDARETEEFVKSTVNKQMMPATAPESQVSYAKLPNSADEDAAQKIILERFELRKGPADVPSYHDFQTLQIAFEHVWTEIFDGQLASLGRELYAEYVNLKDFTGSSAPDPTISTLADLKRLIEEVKSLTNFTAMSMPGNANGGASTSPQAQPITPKEWTEVTKLLFPDPVSGAILDWFRNLFAGKQTITWNSFPLPMRGETINVYFEEQAVAEGEVEIVVGPLDKEPWKMIHFREFDGSGNLQSEFQVSNDARDKDIYHGSLPLYTGQLRYGLLEFHGETDSVVRAHRSYYVLAGLSEKIKDRMRISFIWV